MLEEEQDLTWSSEGKPLERMIDFTLDWIFVEGLLHNTKQLGE